jgi:hypothetical protein
MEQILSAYTAPVVSIRYDVVDYRGNTVGLIEILRNRAQLPDAVKKAPTGTSKRITMGTI